MDRDIPTFNRTVMQRIYAKNHQLHLKRLKNIKSGVSTNKTIIKPQSSYLQTSNSIIDTNYHAKLPQYNNLKKQINRQTKNAQIQRQNALLYQKMIKIMKRPDKNNDPSTNRQRASVNAAKQRLSMQFTRINEQNRAFCHRLEQQRPTIDNKKLEEERLKNLNILKFLGKYPNQQAISKASQYRTYELRSKRMSSTSNRIYQKNMAMNNHQQEREQNDGEQYYINFRNQIIEYDQQQKRNNPKEGKIKDSNTSLYQKQINKNKQNDNSFNKTFYAQTGNSQNNQIDYYEPVVPSRRKFISQGQSRHTNSQIHTQNLNNYNQQFSYFQKQQDFEPYPYHLNHPSHNMAIQDRNNFNKVHKNIKNMNDQKTEKPFFHQQRKLNTRNSQQNILNGHEKINQLPQKISQTSNIYEKNEEPEPVPRFTSNVRKDYQSTNQIRDNLPIQIRRHQLNMILLYKSTVYLNNLLLEQQKWQLFQRIKQQIQQSIAQSQSQIAFQLFDFALQEFSSQISIHRLPDSYKISIQNDSFMRVNQSTRKKNRKQEKCLQDRQRWERLDQNLRNMMCQLVSQMMLNISEVEIPEKQGSMLLQQIDYDYKKFISKMVKIQKQDEYEQDQDENFAKMTGQDNHVIYKLVIVLNQQDEDNLESQKNNQTSSNQSLKYSTEIANQKEQFNYQKPFNESNKQISPIVQKENPSQNNNQQEQKIIIDQLHSNQPQIPQKDLQNVQIPPQEQQKTNQVTNQDKEEQNCQQAENHNYIQALDQELL